MKITSLELFKVAPRWLFLKTMTDEGICGWGEPVIEGRADTVEAAVKELSSYLIGRDPFQIEDIVQTLYRGGFYRGGPILSSAISGIEQSLWDIKGKALNVPVYELLGGAVRDKIQVYCWIGGDRPDDTAAAALGFDAVIDGVFYQRLQGQFRDQVIFQRTIYQNTVIEEFHITGLLDS